MWRRDCIFSIVFVGLSACSDYRNSDRHVRLDNPDHDSYLRNKFRGINGGEKMVTALEKVKADIYIPIVSNKNGEVEWYLYATPNGVRGRSYSNYGGGNIPLPKVARFVRFADDAQFIDYSKYPRFDGSPIVDISLPIADRIPDDLLDDLRRNPGGVLRIKIMFYSEGFFVGWDIERRPGYDGNSSRRNVYVAPVHSFAGGDFREAHIVEGKVVRPGWYLHPKTGERIEIDF